MNASWTDLRQAAALAILAALAGCGGGGPGGGDSGSGAGADSGGAVIGGPGGSGGTAGPAGPDGAVLTRFGVTPDTLSVPASGTTPLTVSFTATSGSSLYWLQSHLYAAGAPQTPTDATRLTYRVCAGALPCQQDQSEACSLSSLAVLRCEPQTTHLVKPGVYTVVGSACVYDGFLNPVCTSRQTTLTIQ